MSKRDITTYTYNDLVNQMRSNELAHQRLFSGTAVSSGPTKYIDPFKDMEPDEVRRLKVRAELRIGSGEELISVAVRKDDGSIEARSPRRQARMEHLP